MKLTQVTRHHTRHVTRELRAAVRGRLDLPRSARLVFDALCDRLPHVFPSYAAIAADAGVTRRTAIRAVAALERAEIIEVARGGGRRNNLYRLRVEHAAPSAAHATSGDTAAVSQPASGDTGDTAEAPPCHRSSDTDVTAGVTQMSPEAGIKPENKGPARPPAGAAACTSDDGLAPQLADAADYGAVHAEPASVAARHIAALDQISRRSGDARVRAMMRCASGADLRRWIAREISEMESQAEPEPPHASTTEAEPAELDEPAPDRTDAPDAAAWHKVRQALRRECGEHAWRAWLSQLTLSERTATAVTLAAPTQFRRDQIANNYGDRVRAAWMAHAPEIRRVEIVAQQK